MRTPMIGIFPRHGRVWHIVRDTHQARLDASRGKIPRVLTFCGEQIVVTDILDGHQRSQDRTLLIYRDMVMSFRVPRLNPETLERNDIGTPGANFQGPVCPHCQERLHEAVSKGTCPPINPDMEPVLFPTSK